jgi:putative peptidoglycan lipid II flippase
MTGIALGIGLGCLVHLAVLAWILRRLGLWLPGAALRRRIARIATASALMGCGLLVGREFLAPSAPALAALCIGGLALYAAAAFMTGAMTRDDVALLAKKT